MNHHSNLSQSSLNNQNNTSSINNKKNDHQNYYDISLNSTPNVNNLRKLNYSTSSLSSNNGTITNTNPSTTSLSKKKISPSSGNPSSSSSSSTTPKRVVSLSSLNTLNESTSSSKRPGDYYIQKLSNINHPSTHSMKPSHPLPPLPTNTNPNLRPMSGESLASFYSDESSSILSSQFDHPILESSLLDSRLNSLTSQSIGPSSGSPSIFNGSSKYNSMSIENDDEDDDSSHVVVDDDDMESNVSTDDMGGNSTTIISESSLIEASNTPSKRINRRSSAPAADFSSPILDKYRTPSSQFNTSYDNSISNSSTPYKNLKSFSSSNIHHHHHHHVSPQSKQQQQPILRSNSTSSASSLMLNRSKTRYISSKEIKERQILRKKKYDDNDNDEEILSTDLDHLVFNVPVIKNQAELYMKNSKINSLTHHHSSAHHAQTHPQAGPISNSSSLNSTTSSPTLSRSNSVLSKAGKENGLSRNDLVTDVDKYNTIVASTNIKPMPLPGRLGSQTDITRISPTASRRGSSSSANGSVVNIIGHHGNLTQNSIIEEVDDDYEHEDTTINSSFNYTNEDIEITQNISQYYNQRSASFSKLIKLSREQSVMYKLPNFIKSQSSMEDLHLISTEKLNLIDQTRPINLPPKSTNDKSKHNKEFKKVLNNYELNTKSLNDARFRTSKIYVQNQQEWLRLHVSLFNHDENNDEGVIITEFETGKEEFNKKFNQEKNAIRKLNWDSNIPKALRFKFFMKILSNNNNSQDSIHTINNSFKVFDEKYKILSDSIKVSKDFEFNKIIDMILERPLFKSIITHHLHDQLSTFKSNFKYLLYIKSLSEFGLSKHDEIFLIPTFLILFQSTQTLQEIYCLLELFNQQIFTREFLSELNNSLSNWINVDNFSSSNYLGKFLHNFKNNDDIKEFENLNSTSFFYILTQLNDQLPLSLSAPSTPILSQSNQFSFTFNSPGSNLNLANHHESSSSSSISPHASKDKDVNVITTTTSTTTIINPDDNDINSSVLQALIKLLQTLIIYSNSLKSKDKNNLKAIQTFLMIIFQYYHIGWNNYQDLIKLNKSIKFNKSADQIINLDSFVDKWKDIFKKS
ncbi:hypothetical protein DFJ63DRAFT_314520 [Scheffersomyces coipomensis]|uniref:uncharacterized protein n=1 Tax=Scheffersomyces coipomensis TaxID=1788519 RepID=UPI00315E00DA